MTSPDPQSNVASSERRRGSREPSPGRVQVRVPEVTLSGAIENRSPQGLFLVLDEALDVQVELEADGKVQESTARLIRVASLPGQRSGWGLAIVNDDSVA